MAKWQAMTKGKIPKYLKIYCKILDKEGLSIGQILNEAQRLAEGEGR